MTSATEASRLEAIGEAAIEIDRRRQGDHRQRRRPRAARRGAAGPHHRRPRRAPCRARAREAHRLPARRRGADRADRDLGVGRADRQGRLVGRDLPPLRPRAGRLRAQPRALARGQSTPTTASAAGRSSRRASPRASRSSSSTGSPAPTAPSATCSAAATSRPTTRARPSAWSAPARTSASASPSRRRSPASPASARRSSTRPARASAGSTLSGAITFANPAAARMLGRTIGALGGARAGRASCAPPTPTAEPFAEALEAGDVVHDRRADVRPPRRLDPGGRPALHADPPGRRGGRRGRHLQRRDRATPLRGAARPPRPPRRAHRALQPAPLRAGARASDRLQPALHAPSSRCC